MMLVEGHFTLYLFTSNNTLPTLVFVHQLIIHQWFLFSKRVWLVLMFNKHDIVSSKCKELDELDLNCVSFDLARYILLF